MSLRVLLLLLPILVTTQDTHNEDIVDLYSKDGPVVHMDHSNFNQLLYGKEHAWVVEFYNSWCGRCQRYAPTWRQVAQEAAGKFALYDVHKPWNNARRNVSLYGYMQSLMACL